MGDDDALPDSVTSNLEGLTKEACEPLTVTQIKRIRSLIDEAVEKVTYHITSFVGITQPHIDLHYFAMLENPDVSANNCVKSKSRYKFNFLNPTEQRVPAEAR